jgi:hypothetical protein
MWLRRKTGRTSPPSPTVITSSKKKKKKKERENQCQLRRQAVGRPISLYMPFKNKCFQD